MTDGAPIQPVSGPLTFDSVPVLYRTSEAWFTGHEELCIDLAGVTRADSAGLALLIEWLRRARAANCALQFVHVPEQLRTLVRVNGLQDVIPTPPA
jgi:phospholipid transport system transporter-binding protein